MVSTLLPSIVSFMVGILLLRISSVPDGPSAKFLVENS